jgi:hypothetical protein
MADVQDALRFLINTSSTDPMVDVITGNQPDIWRGTSLRVEFGIFKGGNATKLALPITNYTSIMLEVKALSASGGAPAPSAAALMQKIVALAALDGTMDEDSFDDGTKQHGIFEFSNVETNLDLGEADKKVFWLVISAVGNTGTYRTLGCTKLTVLEDATAPGGAAPPIGDPDYYTAAQSDARFIVKSGDTMTGFLVLSATPTAALHAATKAYVDTNDALSVLKAGSTMTGLLTLSGAPSSNLHAATKLYVDTGDALALPLTGGTMSGQLNFSGTAHAGIKLNSLSTTQKNALTGVAGMLLYDSTLTRVQSFDGGTAAWHSHVHLDGDTMTGALILSGAPTVDLHAATKLYVDTADASALPKAGGTMTGALVLSGAPSIGGHATTKTYVDTLFAGSVSATVLRNNITNVVSVQDLEINGYGGEPMASPDDGIDPNYWHFDGTGADDGRAASYTSGTPSGGERDGATNPNLISRIGMGERLCRKTLGDTIFDGTMTGTAIFGGTMTFNGPTITAPSITGTISGAPTIQAPTLNNAVMRCYAALNPLNAIISTFSAIGGGTGPQAPAFEIDGTSYGSGGRDFNFGIVDTAENLWGTDTETVQRLGDDAGLFDTRLATYRGAAFGVASLDASAKIIAAQLPDSILGQVQYQGTWDANANNPTIPTAATGNKGYYYIVATAGASSQGGITDWKVGDWIISNGATWSKVDNTDAVSTVFGRAGAIVAVSGDYTTALVTESGNLYYTDVRVRACTLTGLSTASGGAVTSSDTILQALGKLEYRENLNDAKVSYTDAAVRACVLTGIDVSTTGNVSASDTVLSALGKLQANTKWNNSAAQFRMKLRSGTYIPQIYDATSALWYDAVISTTMEGIRNLALSDSGEA